MKILSGKRKIFTGISVSENSNTMQIRKNIAISDSGFLFDPSTGESYTFNPTGLEIFRYMKDEKSFEEIREIILGKYDVDRTSFERFYYDFVSMLKQYQLIENGQEKD